MPEARRRLPAGGTNGYTLATGTPGAYGDAGYHPSRSIARFRIGEDNQPCYLSGLPPKECGQDR